MLDRHINSIAIILFIIIIPVLAFGDNGTIITKSGERYEDIDFKFDENFKVLTFKLDKEQIYISLLDVETVLDESSNDITDDILNGKVGTIKNSWSDSQLEKPEKYRKKPYNLGITVAPFVAIPTFDYDKYGIFLGIGADAVLPISNRHALRFSILKYDAEKNGYEFSGWIYSASFQWFTPTPEILPGKGRAYCYLGAGMFNETKDTRFGIYDHFYIPFGSGIEILINKKISFDLAWFGSVPLAADLLFIVEIDLKAGLTVHF